jgi:hypothetical protein
MIFRVHFMTSVLIPHVYVRIFASHRPGATFAGLGNLTMRKEEFRAFRQAFSAEFVESNDLDSEDVAV